MNIPNVQGLLRAENLAHKYTEQRRGALRKRTSRGTASIAGMTKNLNSMRIIKNSIPIPSENNEKEKNMYGLSVKENYAPILNNLLLRSNHSSLSNHVGRALISNESPNMLGNFEVDKNVLNYKKILLKN